jgi:Family of unknown function (DUF6134)
MDSLGQAAPFRSCSMSNAGCRIALVYLALLASACSAWADDTEHREFSVFVDGKDAGISRMTVIQKDDGTSYMSATLDVKFRHLLVVEYVLKIETQEWWKDGKLVGMKTNAFENGKKTDVIVALDKAQLRMRVNGKDTVLKSDVWTNSYWKLADARFHNKQIPIVEVDTGKEFNCDLTYVRTEKIKIAGKFEDCYRFLVAAAPGPIDLWFDKYHRLVRQEFTESGHKTIVQLVNVKR